MLINEAELRAHRGETVFTEIPFSKVPAEAAPFLSGWNRSNFRDAKLSYVGKLKEGIVICSPMGGMPGQEKSYKNGLYIDVDRIAGFHVDDTNVGRQLAFALRRGEWRLPQQYFLEGKEKVYFIDGYEDYYGFKLPRRQDEGFEVPTIMPQPLSEKEIQRLKKGPIATVHLFGLETLGIY